MNISDFDYDLPESCIAQTPVEPRDSSRLMILNRQNGHIEHRIFRDIADYLNAGDVLVINTTRVIPARLKAVKTATGGSVELLLLRQLDDLRWQSLVGGRKVAVGTRLDFPKTSIYAEVVESLEGSERIVAFSQPVNDLLEELGETPLPPYIRTRLENGDRYQTVYNRQEGSAAAPTAGLHFTPDLLMALREKGIRIANCVLHIGLDTFQPVKVDRIEDHHMHSEYAYLSPEDARTINDAKLAGKRIIAVGTTSARTLETAGLLSAGLEPSEAMSTPNICPWRPVTAFERDTNLFIYPGYRWRVVDAIITNFHLPKSTLLMMMMSFASKEIIHNAYETAKSEGYRFFSFGDAMFINS
jgi:S-adenosylmethionine:tRNA ribosyltransferase-isomerase